MFNWEKKSFLLSRNVIWLNKSYGEFKGITNVNVTEIDDIYSDDSDDNESVQSSNSEGSNEDEETGDEDNEPIVEMIPSVSGRTKGLSREIRNLTTSFNPSPGNVESVEMAMLQQVFSPEATLVNDIPGFDDGNSIPQTYAEVKTSKFWNKAWEAMCLEFNNMETKHVWEICKKTDIPNNRKVIGNRWVYALKDDGRFRARTVAKGFSQIPGKDFQENHAPVVNDTTFHLVLTLKLLFGLESGQFDVETAFLYGDLDEELWMVFPDGYVDYLKEKHNKSYDASIYCLKLKKAIYGLVQAARQWWQKFKQAMLSLNFKASIADPCLFTKSTKGQTTKSFVLIYVDDGGIFGSKEDIKNIINALSVDFKIKYLGKLEHFVGCHVIENNKNDTIWIHQPKLIKNLKQNFERLITSNRVFLTPASPNTLVIRPEKDDTLISKDEQKIFRSGVGMLLYLVKHSRPDIANATRELSKVADGATQAHFKYLLRVIKYVLDSGEVGLKLKPKKKGEMFYLEGISDSEYASDKDTRISVFGYILYFCGAPIAWKSKAGKSVTLSSTEAEYFALSEVTKEAIFIKQVIDSIGLALEFPITVKVDNVGAIYLAKNYSTSQRTKHIDIRTHFVREFVEDGIIKVVFVKSEDNDADIFTKNTTEELFKKHSKKMIDIVKSTNND
jgi:hypothetical protein